MPCGLQPPSHANSLALIDSICLLIRKDNRLCQIGHVCRIWLVLHFPELVAEGVSNLSVNADELVLVPKGGGVKLDYLYAVHLLDLLVQLGEPLVIEGKGWTGALGNLGHEVVNLMLPAPLRNELDVTTRRLKDPSDGKESLNVIRIDQLLSTKDVDEVECLQEHELALRVNYANDRVVRRLLQARLLNLDSELLRVSSVDLLECLDHQLVHGRVSACSYW